MIYLIITATIVIFPLLLYLSEGEYRCHKHRAGLRPLSKVTRVVKVSFNQWKTLCEADPTNWKHQKITTCYSRDYVVPCYCVKDYTWLVQFPTSRDYRRYTRYMRKEQNAERNYTNQEALLELTQIIQQEVEKRVEETIAHQKDDQIMLARMLGGIKSDS